MAELSAPSIREMVREKYAALARGGSSCCGGEAGFGSRLYDDADVEGATPGAVGASLGCGVPTAVADLHAGETVLDLGSGAGADVLISARRVGPSGRAIGLDMTAEMLALARANAAAAGVSNAEFLEGYIEDIPLPDASARARIERFIDAETSCCPFFDMRLTELADGVVLTIDVPVGAEPMLAELVGAFHRSPLGVSRA